MKRILLAAALCLSLGAATFAQQAAGPQPKSQKELDAVLAIQNAAAPQDRINAAQALLKDFKDTEFKEYANYMMMLSYQQLNDFDNMLIYGERTLEQNPDNIGTLISLSYAIPTRTREFDLDKEEKLAKAEDYAKKALVLIPNLAKPNPSIPDDQWLLQKKDFMSQAHESLGLVAIKREDWPAAEVAMRQSLQVASEQTGSAFYHLALALQKQGKKDEAMNVVDQSIARGGFPVGGTDLAAELKKELQGGN